MAGIRALEQQIKTKLSSAYALIGADDVIKENALNLIIKKFRPEETVRMRAENTAGEILAELNSGMLFAKRKLVILNEADKFKPSDFKTILGFEKNPDTLLAIVGNWKPEFKKIFPKYGVEIVDCWNPYPQEVEKIIRSEAAKNGFSISSEATRLLISLSKSDLKTILENLEKAISYADDEKELTEETIRKICVEDPYENTFEFAETLFLKDARTVNREMLKLDKKQHFPTLAYLIKTAEKALILWDMARRGEMEEGFGKMKIWKKQQPFFRRIASLPVEKLEKTYSILLDAEENMKSGLPHAFENATSRISGILGKRGNL